MVSVRLVVRCPSRFKVSVSWKGVRLKVRCAPRGKVSLPVVRSPLSSKVSTQQ